MKYSQIDKIRIFDYATVDQVKSMIKNSSSDVILLASSTYNCLQCDDFDCGDEDLIIPVIVPYNDNVSGPFGRKIKHINIESNLKIQPFFSHSIAPNFFIPFAVIANRDFLLSIIDNCSYSVFLELSLLSMIKNIKLIAKDDWLCTVKLTQEPIEVRKMLSIKYGIMYDLMDDHYVDTNIKCIDHLYDRPEFRLNTLVKHFRGRSVSLIDQESKYYNCVKNYDTTVSVNTKFNTDFYILSDIHNISNIDTNKLICQVSMNDVNSTIPVDSRILNYISYGVKQFSSDISFEPPFTKSSSQLLTALEIICYFKPFSITVFSDDIIPFLLNFGDNSESIKRQIFITKIIEFCKSNSISLNVFGDICSM